MSDVLLCTDTFHDEHRERIEAIAPDLDVVALQVGRTPSSEDLERVTIAFFSHDAWPERAPDFFRAATKTPNLEWMHTMSAGVDSPVFASFLDRGVTLTNSSGQNAAPIARTVMMYLLALTRDLPNRLRDQDRHEWNWRRWHELEDRTVAVVGWGPIGQEVARLADAFGMRPTAVRRRERGDEGVPVRRLDDIESVAADHDVMVVALPLTDDTEGIISAAVLDAVGPTGIFVNVGRGELVDQGALTSALVDGRLGAAALDVTTPEPLPADDPLWDAPNLIITPHNSGSTDLTGRRIAGLFLTNLGHRMAGEPLVNVVESTR